MIFQKSKDNRNKVGGEQRWPVVTRSVDPAVQEVVVTVWETLSLPEEFLGSSLVELCTSISIQRQVRDMEVGILSPLDPLSPRSSLEVNLRPVPSVLTLNDVELAIKAKSHGRVTSMATSTPHNNRVKTIKSHDSKEVTRLDSVWVNLNLFDSSGLKVIVHGGSQEINIDLFHILWNMGTHKSGIRIASKSTNESLKGSHERLNTVLDTLTEQVGFDASISNILLLISSWNIESNLVSTVSPVDLEMVELSVCKVKSISAVEILWVLEFNFQLKLSAANVREAQVDGLEAHTLESRGRVGRSGLSTENRQELEGGVSRVVAVSAVINWLRVVLIGRVLTGDKLLSQELKVISLLLIVIVVLL